MRAFLVPPVVLLLAGLCLTSFSALGQKANPATRIKELGIELPSIAQPMANYVHVVRSGNLLFLAGKVSTQPDGTYLTGKLGRDLSIDQGYQAARSVAITQLAVLQAELGDLRKVKRIVKVLGMVNADPTFTDHPKVMNGFSDLMVQVFGEKGKHARSAVGVSSLPANAAVEVELIVEIK